MNIKFIVNASFLEKPESDNNGVLRFCRELSLSIKLIDPNVQFICSKKIPDSKYSRVLNPIKVGFFKGQLWEQIFLPIYMYLKFGKFFLLNLNNISPVLYNRNISSILDLTWKHFPETFDKKVHFYLSLIVPINIRRSKGIITLSEYSKKDILNNYEYNSEKIKVIYPGFYSNKKNIDESSGMEILNSNNIIPGRFFLATMYKNPERLILAFENLNINGEYKLVFFGTLFESVFGHLKNKFQKNQNLVYLGKVSDGILSYLYANAFAFVYPSLNEGFGMPPLEAMDANCPVIASSVASIPEVCDDAALYVNPYDINSIKEMMQKLIGDPNLREQLVLAGNRRIKLFSYEKSALSVLKYFDNINLYI